MCLSTICHHPCYFFYSLECNSSAETRVVLLDISKASERVWHKRLLLNLKRNSVRVNLLQSVSSSLSGRVTLNCQISGWKTVFAGAPQGSILGPNDLTNDFESNVNLFADDACFILGNLWSLKYCNYTEHWL